MDSFNSSKLTPTSKWPILFPSSLHYQAQGCGIAAKNGNRLTKAHQSGYAQLTTFFHFSWQTKTVYRPVFCHKIAISSRSSAHHNGKPCWFSDVPRGWASLIPSGRKVYSFPRPILTPDKTSSLEETKTGFLVFGKPRSQGILSYKWKKLTLLIFHTSLLSNLLHASVLCV